MCFSAEISFGAGVVIASVGTMAVIKSKNNLQRFFALIPLLFAFQQISEGFLWLSLSNPYFLEWQQVMTFTFLVIAIVLWPLWVPMSVLFLEKNPVRKRILFLLLAIGITVAIYHIHSMIIYNVDSKIRCQHIFYSMDFPLKNLSYRWVFYFIPSVLPFFISGIRSMRYIGIVFVISFIVTKIFYDQFLVSVWCFFAALLSVLILLVILRLPKKM